jgi:phosphatidate cytidylyltransferase
MAFRLPPSLTSLRDILTRRRRLLTGSVLLAVLVVGLALGGRPLRFMVLAAALLGLLEFYGLLWPGRRNIFLKGCGLFCGGGMILGQEFFSGWPVFFLLSGFAAAALAFLAGRGRNSAQTGLEDCALMVLALVYIPLPMALALPLPTAEQALILAAAISSDTGAYYAGTRFGRHKIWPSVSPKKSWEGSFGGLAACVLLCLLAGSMAAEIFGDLPPIPLWGWLCAGILLNLAAQIGDFFESALKRCSEVKDSGFLFPGHGGMLDRLDSILFVIPAYLLLRTLAESLAP